MQAKGGAQDRDSETMTSTLYYTCMYVCLTILCVVMCITVHNAIHSANEGYANVTMSLFLMEELRLNFVYNNLTPRSWHKMHVYVQVKLYGLLTLPATVGYFIFSLADHSTKFVPTQLQ